MSTYAFSHEIGCGAFGSVWAAADKQTGKQVAIKRVRLQNAEPMLSQSDPVLLEVAAMNACRDTHVLPLLDWFIDNESCANLVVSLCPFNLETHAAALRQARSMDEATLRGFALDILLGLSRMHARRIVHRDLKPANILVDELEILMIADLGLAAALDSVDDPRINHRAGTPAYQAPEQRLAEPVLCVATDIFSLGATLCQLWTGETPPDFWVQQGTGCLQTTKMLQELLRKEDAAEAYYRNLQGSASVPMRSTSIGLVHFLALCLREDHEKRPTAAQLLQHPWLEECEDPQRLIQFLETVDGVSLVAAEEENEQSSLEDRFEEMLGELSGPSSPESDEDLLEQQQQQRQAVVQEATDAKLTGPKVWVPLVSKERLRQRSCVW